MTFNDIFKSSFLENVSSISVIDMLLTIVLSFGIGLFIFLIYKRPTAGNVFCRIWYHPDCPDNDYIYCHFGSYIQRGSFLGMVGALSIVRFRTAIKDPLDIAFCFGRSAQALFLQQA